MMDEHDGEESRTDIDSHANMVVVKKHSTILSTSFPKNTLSRRDTQ